MKILNIDDLKKEWVEIKNKTGKYPTAQELPAGICKQIERNHGGLVKLRKDMGLEVTDYSKGKDRSEMISKVTMISIENHNGVQKELIGRFGKRPRVIYGEIYTEGTKKGFASFGVYHKYGHFFVDLISPKDIPSFSGCLNAKINKVKDKNIVDTIYFVCMNGDINQEKIDEVVYGRKSVFGGNIKVISYSNFLEEILKYEGLE